MEDCFGLSLIRQAGAVSFQVCRQAATLMVLPFWIARFPYVLNTSTNAAHKFAGMVMSIFGTIWYPVLEMRNHDQPVDPSMPVRDREQAESEMDPLLIGLGGAAIHNANREELV
jgi:hypothetical protein